MFAFSVPPGLIAKRFVLAVGVDHSIRVDNRSVDTPLEAYIWPLGARLFETQVIVPSGFRVHAWLLVF